jgi:hypothetical protein
MKVDQVIIKGTYYAETVQGWLDQNKGVVIVHIFSVAENVLLIIYEAE